MTSGDWSRSHTIAYGIDDSLKDGAKLYATRFFWDDGGRFLDSWIEIGGLSSPEVKELVAQRGFNQRDLNNALYDLIRDPDEWYEFQELADWLVKNGAKVKKRILHDIWINSDTNNFVKLIEWLLSPVNSHLKIDVNSIVCGHTFLDDIYRRNTEDVHAKQCLIDLLLQHGAKTYKELSAEQALKFGYPEPVFSYGSE